MKKNQLGKKRYELTNWLGNVNVVVSDRKQTTQASYIDETNAFESAGNVEGWLVVSPATRVATGGQLVVTTSTTNNYTYKNFTTVVGEEYTVTVNATQGTSPGIELVVPGSTQTITSGVTKYITFTATATSSQIRVKSTGTTGSTIFYVQDINIRTQARYDAVALMKADYYPFGMTMPGRSDNANSYRYAYNGMEQDQELKGQGNSYDYGARMYDPRLGRWFTQDPLKHLYPSESPYSYALNTPISAKDADGRYTIFVNGYIHGNYPGPFDDIEPGKPYWRGALRDPEQFVNAAHTYFGDGIGDYVNGTGNDIFSMAWTRQKYGREIGKVMADELLKKIKEGADIKEINFVTHSMGSAVAEGIIEEFMKHPELAGLLKKGEIVHFSACDADDIVISENSKDLKRTQINYFGDGILKLADPDIQAVKTGGHLIPGVTRFGVVLPNLEKLHPDYKGDDWEWHHDTKTFKQAWDFLRILDKKLKSDRSLSGKPVFIEYNELEPVDSEIEKGGVSEAPTENKG